MTHLHETTQVAELLETQRMYETLEAISSEIENGEIGGIELIGAHPDDSLYWFLTARYLC